MSPLPHNAIAVIDDLSRSLTSLGPLHREHQAVLARLTLHLTALRHHVARDMTAPRIVVVLGGTGTGKSTLVNRLLETEVTATSFRRTFTAGAVAVLAPSVELPDGFAGLPTADEPSPPTRGTDGRLTRVRVDAPLLRSLILIDSPDLDGSVREHHATADRLFRFADVALFVTTPEKYQMKETWPFYHLARRYALPSLFVINKLDEPGPAADFERQLRETLQLEMPLFHVSRDDSGHAVDPARSLDALRAALLNLPPDSDATRRAGQKHRARDLVGRIEDELLCPLEHRRKVINEIRQRLKQINPPTGHVDVAGMAAELRRRLEDKSLLYLLGPRRVLERLRQVPGLIARLPRSTWDLLTQHGRRGQHVEPPAADQATLPDFRQELIDLFRVHQARLDELLRPCNAEPDRWQINVDAEAGEWKMDVAAKAGERRMDGDPEAGECKLDVEDHAGGWKMDVAHAGAIADSELAELKNWLAQHWNDEPRDTRFVRKLLGKLPGGARLVQLSEAAPYLLTVACVVKGALLGPLDLVILGGFFGTTWLLERMSNEVRSKVHDTNRRIEQRFAALIAAQNARVDRWLDQQAPTRARLDRLQEQAYRLNEAFDDHGRLS